MEFKPGDVVLLKSGSSPRMTVSSLDNGRVHVSWFNYEGHKFEIQHATFHASMLKKISTSD